MSLKHRAMLAASVFAATAAVGTSGASAVEVSKEGLNEDCGIFVAEGIPGECPVRGEANDLELGGIFGVMNVCDTAFEGNINEGGALLTSFWDWDYWPCESGSTQNCTGAGSRHPTFDIVFGSTGGPWTLETSFCAVAFGLTINCHVAGQAVETGAHDYALTFAHTNKCENNSSVSLQGTLDLTTDAAHPAIELE